MAIRNAVSRFTSHPTTSDDKKGIMNNQKLKVCCYVIQMCLFI